MRVLVTGANGFVGKYLMERLKNIGYDVYGCDVLVNGENNYYAVNLIHEEEVLDLIKHVNPEHIYHLAGVSDIASSWENPVHTFDVNVKGTLNLLNAVRTYAKGSRVLLIGSSEEYGVVKPENNPVNETMPLTPTNPYALSKYAAENLGIMYHRTYGLNMIFVRAFNHIGAGQAKGFAVPDFCAKISNAERGLCPDISVGNLEAIRDFTDVRDIVNGYILLMQKGLSGEVYNIGSGKGYRIKDILDLLISISSVKISVKADPSKIRSSEIPMLICDNSKIKRDVGFETIYSITETLKDTLDFWREK